MPENEIHIYIFLNWFFMCVCASLNTNCWIKTYSFSSFACFRTLTSACKRKRKSNCCWASKARNSCGLKSKPLAFPPPHFSLATPFRSSSADHMAVLLSRPLFMKASEWPAPVMSPAAGASRQCVVWPRHGCHPRVTARSERGSKGGGGEGVLRHMTAWESQNPNLVI